ncbi:CENP-S complex, centromere protein X [Ophiocordyceps camponoti-floridani]|uniref:CENP-S complex, centromere protein X n=1 Tax=Ophiocordyceps camponoti-floridani TaxID=2030778 RepID=A0A8H4Q419_9HYPO|nr:CENP-S complex, centromere protein X [Ophiocordyceps camponoti-floridani]
MPPKQAAGAGRGRGRPKGSKKKQASATPEPSNPFEPSDGEEEAQEEAQEEAAQEPEPEAEEQPEPEKMIPRDLLTRVLHEFFVKDATRISRDANAAVGKYVDVFVREAIARAAVDKRGGFLEVEDLEKIAPQLLLDL